MRYQSFHNCYPESAKRLIPRRIHLTCLYLTLQTSDTTLEEFLEELDALTDAVAEEGKDGDSTENASTDLLSLGASEDASASAGLALPHKEDSSPRSSEKKVRFSEKFLQPALARQTAPSQDSADSESTCLSSLNTSTPQIEALERILEDQEGCPVAPPVAEQQPSENECTEPDSSPSSGPPSADRGPSSVYPAELSKCNINSTNAGETRLTLAHSSGSAGLNKLMLPSFKEGSGLSVLSLESGETHPAHPTSSDKVSV